TTQLLEQMPTRGFQSSVDPRLHFGLGTSNDIDSLIVIWPDRRFQVLTHVAADRAIALSQQDATALTPSPQPLAPVFADVTDRIGVDFKHRENSFYDYNRQPLIPHVLSREGPALAVADVNGDGLDDFYVGGAKWQAGELFIQQRDGTFRRSTQPALQADSLAEDVAATFFDANGDGYPDLYVVSGGNEFWGGHPALQDRLYINDGKGNFHRDAEALPRLSETGSCVAVGDWNGDGHPDLFVGRRVVAGQYGVAPRSYLLENDGTGHFHDVTLEQAPALAQAGLSPQLRSRYPSYADFGASRVDDIFPAAELKQATVLEARVFASSVAWNNGDGTFTLRPLSVEAQFAPVYASLAADFDGDGR